MEPGFYGADRGSRHALDFLQLVPLRVVQQHDESVFIAELLQCRIQAAEFLQPFPVFDRVEIAGQVGKPLSRQMSLVDEVHALAGKAPVLIDELVVHHAAQPGARFLDMNEFVEHAECLDQQLLEQVFGFGLAAGEPPRQPVKAVEMRSHKALEDLGLVWVGHRTAECIATATPFGKDVSCYSCRKAAGSMKANTLVLTAAAMVAFAANSVLCRLALGAGLIDAASFATVRTISGAVMLGVILLLRRKPVTAKPDWRSVLTLYLYMVFFAFAYLSLSAGTGALILFGAVQLTMFTVALRSGEHFSAVSWAGLLLASAGLIYLVSPGLSAPDPLGAALMTVAGVSWGFYSLVGRSSGDPTEATAHNFLYAVPLVVVTSLVFVGDFEVTPAGAAYAVASGAVASGIGYAIWYTALKGLSGTGAATVQLSVPVIAAIGGVLLLSEAVTLRLIVASAATLGGVALVLTQRNRSR